MDLSSSLRWRTLLILRQIIVNFVPRGLRFDPDVELGPDAGVTVDEPGAHNDDLRLVVHRGVRVGAAFGTEPALLAR